MLFFVSVLFAATYVLLFAEPVSASEQNTETEDNMVYNFKDPKKEGTITFIKKWKDNKNNDERQVPNIEISTRKPGKNVKGYTVTFHGNGMKFADGTTENELVFNSSKDIVEGQYKLPGTSYIFWYTEPECKNKVKVSNAGVPDIDLNGDIDLYARSVTFVLKDGVNFSKLIPDDVTSVIFTDEEMPRDIDKSAVINGVDYDDDGGVVAWVHDGVMKVSTQIEGVPIQFYTYSNTMFSGKSNITNIEFNNVDTSNVTSIAFMFQGCKGLTKLNLSAFDTANVIIASGIFSECSNLAEIDVSGFNTAKMSAVNAMFKNCSSLLRLDVSAWDTGRFKNMGDMFNGCSSLAELDVSGWDTSNVSSMGYTFFNCRVLTVLDVSNFDTSRVNTFVGMFSGCNKIKELDVSGWNTQNVTNMGEMFYACYGLTTLDVSNFNTAKVTNMAHMFNSCSNVQQINASSFDTSNVEYMQYMFAYCRTATEINVSNFNTLKVKGMELMFYGCNKLLSLDLSSFDTPNVTNICNMFNLNYALTYLDLSNFDTSKVTNMNWTFSNLNKLRTLKLGNKFAFLKGDDGSWKSGLAGTWINTDGEEFASTEIPNNVADTYTKK